MSLEFDTSKTFNLILKSDADAPAETQPTYSFRYLTARESSEVEDHFTKSHSATDNKQWLQEIVDGLRICLVGWKNVQGNLPFNANDIASVASNAELIVLRDNLLREMTMSELDKKKVVSPSRASMDSSANSMAKASV